MLLKSDMVHKAWAATQRTVGVKLTIKETEYDASDITSLTFDSGAMNGEALTLGSTYQNTIKVVFSNLIEGLALTDEITPELGIKLPDGTWDYTPLGVFVIDAEVQQDRNNNTTTVSASDRMCMLGGTYESKLTYPAAISDIAVEIANLAAVKINEDDFARLPTGKVASFGKVTYRDAIGFVAQFAGGFATFDRDGLLDIRQLADPNFEVAPSQYQSKGLTKNEALYRIGGIACTVTTTTTDDSGTETQDTKTLQSGSSAGTQITISNPGMTQDLLDGLYEQLQDLNFYPFSLSWFGDPNLEAGDWIEVQDTAGNTFKTPNLLYALTFSGGVTATSKADTTVSASANFVYKGQLNQVVNNIRQYLNASGHAVSEGIDEPKNPKAGDIWFKKDGPDTTIMTYVVDPETGIGSWSEGPSTKPDTKITDALQQAEDDVAAAQKQADNAVAQALAAVNASGLATASAQAANDTATAAKQLATQVSDSFATVQSQAATAASDAATALDQAKSALATANGLSGDYTTLKKIVDDTTATVSTLATQTSVDAVKQTVTTTQALAEQTANGLSLKADTTVVDTINNTVKQQAIDIKAAQDQLALKITASDLAKGLSGYATQTWAQNQITATAKGWEAQLSTVQTSLEAKNLVTDSEFLDTSNLWMISTYTGSADFKPGIDGGGSFRTLFFKYSSFSDAKWSFAKSQKVDVTAITALSASTRIWTATTDVSSGAELQIEWYDSAGKIVSSGKAATESVAGLQGKWQTIKSENVSKPTGAVTASLVLFVRQNGQYWFSYPMMNAGTTVADYHPGVADSSQFATLKLTVDGLSATFAKKTDLETTTAQLKVTADGLNLLTTATGAKGEKVTQVIADVDKIQTTMTGPNGVTTRLQTLEGFQQTATATLAGVATTSQVTQLADQLTSVVGAIGQKNWVYNSQFENGSTDGWTGDTSSYYYTSSPWSGMEAGSTVGINNASDTNTIYRFFRSKRAAIGNATVFSGSVDIVPVLVGKRVGFEICYYADATSGRIENSGSTVGYRDVWITASANAKQTVKIENFSAPPGAKYVGVALLTHGAAHSGWQHPMLVAASKVGPYQPDSVGSSQITQLQGLIDDRVLVDGKIAAALSLSADGGGTVLITGKSVHITGDTTIDNAVIKSAMIDTITADKIIAGTLNAGLINVIGMNASAITTGTITGANLAINLNTGQVVFQSGRINDMANHVDINIDPYGGSSYLSVADSYNRVLLKGGEMQFIAPTLFDLQTSPYLSISNDGIGSNWAGATIVGRDSIMLANSANVGSSIMTWELGLNTFSGLFSGKNSNGTWNPTILGGAERGVVIVGGPLDDGTVKSSPMIRIGSSTDGQSAGNRIYVRSSYLIVPSIYSKTTGSSANVVVLGDGSLHRSTSASKYKTMIERSRSTDMGEALLNMPTAHWYDKAEMTSYANGEQTQAPKLNFGMIAEDLAAAGLEDLVVRGDTGELEGINYDRIAPALLPLLAKMKQEIEELKGEK